MSRHRIDATKIRIRPLNPYLSLLRQQQPELGSWPETCDHVCWYCCHPFTWTPAFLPIDVQDGVFTFMGYYCSWNCVARYARDYEPKHYRAHSYIGILAYLTGPRGNPDSACDPELHETGLCDCLFAFTPLSEPERKEVIQMFGGKKTIEQYRAGFHCIHDYEWVRRHFLRNEKLGDVISAVQAGQRQQRDWGFRHVYFPSPPLHEFTHVIVLPHTHRTMPGGMIKTGNEETQPLRSKYVLGHSSQTILISVLGGIEPLNQHHHVEERFTEQVHLQFPPVPSSTIG